MLSSGEYGCDESAKGGAPETATVLRVFLENQSNSISPQTAKFNSGASIKSAP
jgi:hypothetical protein